MLIISIKVVCANRPAMNLAEFVVIMHVLKKIKDGSKMFKKIPAELNALIVPPAVTAAPAGKAAGKAVGLSATPKAPVKPTKLPPKSGKSPRGGADEEDENVFAADEVEMKEVSGRKSPRGGAKEMKEEEEEEWEVSEAVTKKIRANFQKLAEGEEELGVGKAMKVFLKSEVKPKDVGSVYVR